MNDSGYMRCAGIWLDLSPFNEDGTVRWRFLFEVRGRSQSETIEAFIKFFDAWYEERQLHDPVVSRFMAKSGANSYTFVVRTLALR